MSAVASPGPAPLFHAVEIDMDVPGTTGSWPTALPWASAPWATLGMSDPTAAATETLRLSDQGYVDDAALVYPPLVAEAFAIDRRLTLSPGSTAGKTAWGSITLNNPGGMLSALVQSRVNDHLPIRISAGRKTIDVARNILLDPPASALVRMFSGLGRSWQAGRNTIDVDLLDLTYWLSMTLRPGTYGGSGGLDGDSNVSGRLRPMVRGWAYNITPVLIDATNLIYQVSNGPAGISAIYEGGWGGSIARASSDTSDIVNASVSAGQFVVQSGSGGTYIKLGSKPVYAITLDVVGRWPSGAQPTAILDVLRQMLVEDCTMPSGWIDSGWATISNAMQWDGGWYWDGSAAVTGQDVVDTLLAGLGVRLMPTRSGTLLPVRLVAGTAALAVTADQVVAVDTVALDDGLDPPTWRWRVGYAHCHTVQAAGSGLHPQIDATHQSFIAQADRIGIWSSNAVLQRYRVPNDPDALTTALKAALPAIATANNHGALFGSLLRAWSIELPKHLALQVDLGATISVTANVPGLTGGANVIVWGEEIRSDQATSTLLVLAGNF